MIARGMRVWDEDRGASRRRELEHAQISALRTLSDRQEREGDVFDPVRERIRTGRRGIRAKGADYLAYAIVDLPMDHPMLRVQFVVTEIPQIPNIGFYRRSGGGTSEQGYDSQEPHARIITDPRGRVMVLMTHNTDISDSWEREGQNPEYFLSFSPEGYALGLNVALYAMMY